MVLSLTVSGLGIVIGSFMRSPEGYQLVLQILVFPMVFLAGVFYPVDTPAGVDGSPVQWA
jgi:ABC-2 type transport system permease protein